MPFKDQKLCHWVEDEYNTSSQERIRVCKMERRPRSQYEKENIASNWSQDNTRNYTLEDNIYSTNEELFYFIREMQMKSAVRYHL